MQTFDPPVVWGRASYLDGCQVVLQPRHVRHVHVVRRLVQQLRPSACRHVSNGYDEAESTLAPGVLKVLKESVIMLQAECSAIRETT